MNRFKCIEESTYMISVHSCDFFVLVSGDLCHQLTEDTEINWHVGLSGAAERRSVAPRMKQ